MLSNSPALVRARGAHGKTASRKPKSEPMAFLLRGAWGVRTANGFAVCGCTLRQWPSRLLLGSAVSGKAIASRMALREAVLPGAPCARPQGRAMASHKAKRFQKRFGPAKGLAKGNRFFQKLFSTFFPHPLAPTSRFCYTCNRQQLGRAFRRGAGNPYSPSDRKENE